MKSALSNINSKICFFWINFELIIFITLFLQDQHCPIKLLSAPKPINIMCNIYNF